MIRHKQADRIKQTNDRTSKEAAALYLLEPPAVLAPALEELHEDRTRVVRVVHALIQRVLNRRKQQGHKTRSK